ncbi:hypothetical protein AND_004573 [Anopheles darlingi]|uniref:Uncharacterized protein n=1 Tax=Anopheles darlingi TaxID=43151 RepID=W5JH61_ANODA|nr:hypothetical protein AND_004573 [Anopheles darlingi]
MLSANWFDGNDMTFKRIPLLPTPTEVYKNFEGRIFNIPVIHKPPWHFVVYGNGSNSGGSGSFRNGTMDVGYEMDRENNITIESEDTYIEVTGGRDHNLMQLIAKRMNFSFQYVEPPEKIQGIALGTGKNASFSGALGMLERREVELFLGDVGLHWERMKAVEFSFFTLADSAAFVTHAPRKLNEALALVRPFQVSVWPPLIITILLSGPILYFIISTPHRWKHWTVQQQHRSNYFERRRQLQKRKPAYYNLQYLQEMSYGGVRLGRTRIIGGVQEYPSLDRCIWYTINVYLRQSRESPINTLGRLEQRMIHDGYQLLVERQSAFHAALVNSSGILQRLYRLTQERSVNDSFLVRSVEEGIRTITYDTKLALSEKLYTRYSAVAVQIGCPFLDSLNEVIMRLFEAGIIEKITIAEYERMFGRQNDVSFAEWCEAFDNARPKLVPFEGCSTKNGVNPQWEHRRTQKMMLMSDIRKPNKEGRWDSFSYRNIAELPTECRKDIKCLEPSLNFNTWLPLSHDLETLISECITKILILETCKDLPAEVRALALNPNEESVITDDALKQTYDILQYLQNKKQNGKRQESDIRRYNSDYLSSDALNALLEECSEFVIPVSALESYNFFKLMKQNSLRFDNEGDYRITDGMLNKCQIEQLEDLRRQINCCCSPSIVQLVKDVM